MRPAVLPVLLAAATLAGHGPRTDGPMIRYTLSLPDRHVQRASVRLVLDDLPPGPVELFMPTWTPGSYLVREFARHVLDLRAATPDGEPVAVDKLDKNTWRVDRPHDGALVVEYALHANEASVRTNHVDADGAFLSPAGTFLAVRGHEERPHHVVVEPPDGWEAFTGLPAGEGGFVAEDIDHLVDSPVLIGPHRVLAFEIDGVPHRIVVAGEAALDEEAFVADVSRLTAEVAQVFGFMPFDDYTFMLLFVDEGGGGLEHRNSSVSMFPRWDLVQPDRYRRLLSLLAHEYFHAWNGKRLRPEALGPFDYERENYTPDLWVAEGVTSYYDDLCTLRAGFADEVGDYLDARAKAFRSESERPAGRRMSLTASSHDAWIKLYRPDENAINSTVSYYSKGALVALLLDLRLRRLTGGAHTLADLLRAAWDRWTRDGRGFPEGALGPLASELSGHDLGPFFADHVEGTEPLRPDPELAWVGLRLAVEPDEEAAKTRALPSDEDGRPLEPDLGLTIRDEGGLCRVFSVREGSAGWRAGINPDDVVLALDGMRTTPATYRDRLDRTGGRPVTVTLYRGQSLRRLRAEPDLKPLTTWKLAPVEEPTDAQREAFERWTGWPFPDPAAGDGGDEGRPDDERDASDSGHHDG